MNSETNPDDWYSDEAATFGDRVAAARDATGMSQRELAARLGVKEKTIKVPVPDVVVTLPKDNHDGDPNQ